MSGSTITNTMSVGVTLGAVYPSPLTITSTGAVDAASGDAIFGPRTYAWTVANYGMIDATGSSADGIHFGYGGSVANRSSGVNSAYIGGTRFGIYITGAAGTVTNSGTIGGTGAGGIGIELHYGGSVGNEAGGREHHILGTASRGRSWCGQVRSPTRCRGATFT